MKERTEIAVILLNGLFSKEGFWEAIDVDDKTMKQVMVEQCFDMASMVIHYAEHGDWNEDK